jgi:ATP-dependent Clp protease ATP-binding subunit ClpA
MAGIYHRFTDRVRKVMKLANQEALRFNHEYIGTEHVLLGLVTDGSGVAASVLTNLHIELRNIRQEVEKIIVPGPAGSTMTGRLPQTPRVKKAIEYAIDEAREMRHNYVGSEHLLLGLLREQEGVAAQILVNLGVNLETVRTGVLDLVGTGCAGPSEYQVTPQHEPAECSEAAGSIQQELCWQIEQLTEHKEAAIATQDFERAALLRDQVDKLKKQKEALRREDRERRSRLSVEPSWLSWDNGRVLRIANAIRHEKRSRDFPVLADALEEAGCSEEEILRHCRQGGTHSQFCWVLDLLLGDH